MQAVTFSPGNIPKKVCCANFSRRIKLIRNCQQSNHLFLGSEKKKHNESDLKSKKVAKNIICV